MQWEREREAAARARARREEMEKREAEARQRDLRDLQAREAAARERDLRERRELESRARRPSSESYGGSMAAPARSPAPSSRSGANGMSCSAVPYCPMASGYGNACKGVKESVARGATKSAIISLCQRANRPEPCGADLPGSPQAKDRYRLAFGGGCAQQCIGVAECSTAASR